MKRLLTLLLLVAAVSCGRTLTVQNPLGIDRNGELVEVKAPTGGPFRLLGEDGSEVPYQLTHDGKLLFPASVPAWGTATYKMVKGKPAPVDTVACGSLRPDRLDDIIWENEHAGWRMYGPGTHAAGAAAYGYDVFTKSVPYPVMTRRFDVDHNPASWAQMDAWRAQGLHEKADSLLHAISFHVDHGDGMDVYSVGASLGCGTAALLDAEGKIVYPWCWERYEILDNGPLRFTVCVTMDGGAETRTITCDAGSWFNRVDLSFAGLEEAPLAAGIVLHSSNPDAYLQGDGVIAYADLGDPNPGANGEIYCGVVAPSASHSGVEQGHLLLYDTYRPGYTYYFGSGWSKAGIGSLRKWCDVLERERERILNPLIVKL